MTPSNAACPRQPFAMWRGTSSRERLSPAESERTERLARVVATAEDVWQDREQARRFLTTPHPEIGGKTPLDAAMTELGARQAEEVMARIVYGLPAQRSPLGLPHCRYAAHHLRWEWGHAPRRSLEFSWTARHLCRRNVCGCVIGDSGPRLRQRPTNSRLCRDRDSVRLIHRRNYKRRCAAVGFTII